MCFWMPGLRAGFPFIRSQPFLRYRCHGLDGAGDGLSSVYIPRLRKRCARCGSETRHLPPLADDRYDHALARRIGKKPHSTNDDSRSIILAVYRGRAKRQGSCFRTENSGNVRAITRKTPGRGSITAPGRSTITEFEFVLLHGKPHANLQTITRRCRLQGFRDLSWVESRWSYVTAADHRGPTGFSFRPR